MLFSLALLTLGIKTPSFVFALTAAFAVLGFISKVASGLFVFIPTFPDWAKAKLVVAKNPKRIICFFIYLFLIYPYFKILTKINIIKGTKIIIFLL